MAEIVLPGMASHLYRFDGEHLWVMNGAILPARCVFTNKSAEEDPTVKPVVRKLAWSSPWFALLILINLLVYLIVALIAQKKATIHMYASVPVLRKKKLCGLGGVLLLVCSLVMIIGGAIAEAEDSGITGSLIAVAGIVSFIISLVLLIRFGNVVRATKHENGWFRLKGCCPEFLSSLAGRE